MKQDKKSFEQFQRDFTPEEFERALENSFIDTEIRPGDKIEGVIVAITESDVFIDIGAKSEAVLSLEEIVDENGDLMFGMNDRLEVSVLSVKDEIKVSYRMRKRDQSREILEEAFYNGVAVQGKVESSNKGGFEIDLGGLKAFCPISQIDLEYVENPDIYLGQNYHFMITKLEGKGRNIVVSRSKLLKVEQERMAKLTLETIRPGMRISGTVKKVTDFGAFVDIGGIEGLIHISHLSWDRVSHPSESVSVGDEIEVMILGIENNGKRISLSLKEATGNPWDEKVGTEIQPGKAYSGTVTRVENFGAFVRLAEGIDGLLHISEMTWGKPINHPSELVKLGDKLSVQVLNIDQDKRRISLGTRQLTGNPWEKVEEEFPVGREVEVEISEIKGAGLEVLVGPDLTGFVPASLAGIGKGEKLQQSYKTGDRIQVKVAVVNAERRKLIFEKIDVESIAQQEDLTTYLKKVENDNASRQQGTGSFGDLLAKALQRKKDKESRQ